MKIYDDKVSENSIEWDDEFDEDWNIAPTPTGPHENAGTIKKQKLTKLETVIYEVKVPNEMTKANSQPYNKYPTQIRR